MRRFAPSTARDVPVIQIEPDDGETHAIEREALFRTGRPPLLPSSGRTASASDGPENDAPPRRTGARYPEGDLPEPEGEHQIALMTNRIIPRIQRAVGRVVERMEDGLRRGGDLTITMASTGAVAVPRDAVAWVVRHPEFIIGGALLWYLGQFIPFLQVAFLHDAETAYQRLIEQIMQGLISSEEIGQQHPDAWRAFDLAMNSQNPFLNPSSVRAINAFLNGLNHFAAGGVIADRAGVRRISRMITAMVYAVAGVLAEAGRGLIEGERPDERLVDAQPNDADEQPLEIRDRGRSPSRGARRRIQTPDGPPPHLHPLDDIRTPSRPPRGRPRIQTPDRPPPSRPRIQTPDRPPPSRPRMRTPDRPRIQTPDRPPPRGPRIRTPEGGPRPRIRTPEGGPRPRIRTPEGLPPHLRTGSGFPPKPKAKGRAKAKAKSEQITIGQPATLPYVDYKNDSFLIKPKKTPPVV